MQTNIEVAIKKDEVQKKRGDLLEEFSAKLLEIQGYAVDTQIRNTGFEVDLKCKLKANPNKIIIVECKAYRNDTISANIITQLWGILKLPTKEYSEGWLMSTCPIGKEAKGLVGEIHGSNDASIITVFSPKDLIELAVSANLIVGQNVVIEKAEKSLGRKEYCSEIYLLISEYGLYWVVSSKKTSPIQGVLVYYAQDGVLVTDFNALSQISMLDTSFSGLDHNIGTMLECIGDGGVPVAPGPGVCVLSRDYVDSINSLGLKINRINGNEFKLFDLYVYPDLDNVDGDAGNYINSKELLTLSESPSCSIILGGELSGKTSLALMMQKHHSENGKYALYLKGADLSNSNIDKVISNAFRQQYGDSELRYKIFKSEVSQNKNSTVLFIDDIHLIKGAGMDVGKLLTLLQEKFNYIFAFANDSVGLEMILSPAYSLTLSGYSSYRIKEFGYVLRDALVKKWISTSGCSDVDSHDSLEKRDQYNQIIKTSVGTDYVPTYPIYLLSILHFSESSRSTDIKGSTYAELYGYLVSESLRTVGLKGEDYDFLDTYLSHFAYSLFTSSETSFSFSDALKHFSTYAQQMEIPDKGKKVFDKLMEARLLRILDEKYKFTHRYVYYFYVSKYLHENLNNSEVLSAIDRMIADVQYTENANCILFLIHRSKDLAIIDKIVEKSNAIFNEVSPVSLSTSEMEEFNSLLNDDLHLTMLEKKPSDYRNEEMVEADACDVGLESDNEKSGELINELNLAFRLVQIQGQILKNHYGSLPLEVKAKILDSIRLLSQKALSVLVADSKTIYELAKNQLEKKPNNNKDGSPDELKLKLDSMYFIIQTWMVLVFVSNTGAAIASRNLGMSLDSLLKRYNNDDATFISVMSAKLNFHGMVSSDDIINGYNRLKNNYCTRTVFRLLIIDYLYKFDISFKPRQIICNKLDIGQAQEKRIISGKFAG